MANIEAKLLRNISNNSLQSDVMYGLYEFRYGNSDMSEEISDYHNLQRNILIAVGCLYIFTLLVSVVGNAVVCYVVFALQRLRNVTNVYIVSMSCSDLLICGLCEPIKLTADLIFQYWPFADFICPTVHFISDTSLTQRSLSLVAMSVDRYYAVWKPLNRRISKYTTKAIISMLWIVSAILSLPSTLSYGVQYRYCLTTWSEFEYLRPVYNITMTALRYYIPLVILCITYIHIGVIVWKKRAPGEVDNNRDMRQAVAKRKMVKMLVAVVVMYAICWFPLHLLPFLMTVEVSFTTGSLFLLARWLTVVNMGSNPFIYCWMNSAFKHGFSRVFCEIAWCKKNRLRRQQTIGHRHRPWAATTTTAL